MLRYYNLKVYSVDDNLELDSIAASPDVEVYFYGPKSFCNSRLPIEYSEKLNNLKIEVVFFSCTIDILLQLFLLGCFHAYL